MSAREHYYPIEEWRTMPWWPNGRDAKVTAGFAGHDREIVVNIDGYGLGNTRDDDDMIPSNLVSVLAAELPETWKIENRGSRIEIHPSGRYAGGFAPEDLSVVKDALERIGLNATTEVTS